MLVAGAIVADFGIGLLLVTRLSDSTSDIIFQNTLFAAKASIVLSVVWVPFYLWSRKRFNSDFLPIIFFPNPYFALILVLILAGFMGGGSL